MKACVLYEQKTCSECGECQRCDLNPEKVCDNCCKCLDADTLEEEYLEIPVADVVMEDADDYLNAYYEGEEEAEREEGGLTKFEPDAALLAEWEEKLKASYIAQISANAMHGVRKRRVK